MRVLGHPVHAMLVHFPVALWPAHAFLALFAARLPAGSPVVGFWILAAGTALGLAAACCGAFDLLALWSSGERRRLRLGLVHGAVNGAALVGFTAIVAREYVQYPPISHGSGLLAAEFTLIIGMFVGNHFGGSIVWGTGPAPQARNGLARRPRAGIIGPLSFGAWSSLQVL